MGQNMGPGNYVSQNRVNFKVAFRTRSVGRFSEIILHGPWDMGTKKENCEHKAYDNWTKNIP